MNKKYLPRIYLKGSQSSPRILGNLSRFAICGGIIRGLPYVKEITIPSTKVGIF